MRLTVPLLPLIIAVVLLGSAYYLFTSARNREEMHFAAPAISRIGDFPGIETEVAIAPDGKQYAAISSGNLWLMNIGDGSRQKLTDYPEAEAAASYPSWMPDGRVLTYTTGQDTWAIDLPAAAASPRMLKAGTTSLEWSSTGRMAFVRDRALWLANSNGSSEKQVVPADADTDITVHSPRFSPDALQLSWIRTRQNRSGEVWLADVTTGAVRALVADLPAENPLDTGWILNGKQLVYLTDRSGAYALWTVDFQANTLLTLTVDLDQRPIGRIGMSVWKDRIVLPRHFIQSGIALSDGATIVGPGELAFEPAISPDGKQIAFTAEADGKFTIWTCGIHGENPIAHNPGRQPRWAANGFELVFTHTDLAGNPEIWKLDLRNNETDALTDAPEIDRDADWQPAGRNVVFASNHTGPMAIWSVPSNGGQRVALNNSGEFPRFSADGRSILFWSAGEFWSMNASGGELRALRNGIAEPAPAVLTRQGAKYYRDAEVHGSKTIWPEFDVLPDGRYLIAPIDIQDTALWAVDLAFATK